MIERLRKQPIRVLPRGVLSGKEVQGIAHSS